MLSRIILLIFLFTFVFTFVGPCLGQVDPTFNALPTMPVGYGGGGVTLQPDGKLIVWGNFQVANGTLRNRVVRINADGTLDESFNCPMCDFDRMSRIIVQPEGKLLIAGSVLGDFRAKLIRVNADGSLDGSFASWMYGYGDGVRVWGVQPDGKIIASHLVFDPSPSVDTLYRLFPNGSIDNSFNMPSFAANASQALYDVKLLPDGQLMVAGSHSYGYLFKVNSDGSRDISFPSPVITGGQYSPFIYSFGFQPDGKVVFVGDFSTVNGVPRDHMARLNIDGSLDTDFNPNLGFSNTLYVLPSGSMLVRVSTGLVRLNADGTVDETFHPFSPGSLVTDDLERIIHFTFSDADAEVRRNTADGDPDPTFAPVGLADKGPISVLASQPDGKILVGGSFTKVNGVVRSHVARLNSDGSLDPSFDTADLFGGSPDAFGLQPDGQILVAGYFPNLPVEHRSLVRLNSDGSRDSSFDPTFSAIVWAIAVQPDGKILASGFFELVNNEPRRYMVRLNSNGTTDAGFSVGVSGEIVSIVPLADGKTVVGGRFPGFRPNLARLNSNGTVDPSFNAGTVPEIIQQVVRQTDGTYFWHEGRAVRHISSEGAPDTTFSLLYINDVNHILPRPDGSVIVGGRFTQVNPWYAQRYITRLKPDGSYDRLFYPAGANGAVNTFLEQPGEKFLAAGAFTMIGGIPRLGIARLSVPTIRHVAPFDFNGDGMTDISVSRPGTPLTWYQLLSPNYDLTNSTFGEAGDISTPADFDGDGTTDIAIFRPSSGDWWWRRSLDGEVRTVQWGANGDIPLPGDVFTGAGKADFVVYRPSAGIWYRMSNNSGYQMPVAFGAPGDKPLLADYDGDGKVDPSVFRPSTATFWYAASSTGGTPRAVQWGLADDVPVPADFDGDGRTDIAVFRPANGIWYIINSHDGSYTFVQFGISQDKPIPADYDGDGRADIAVFRPSTGIWYLLQSTSGFAGFQWGISTDIPSPAAYIPQ